MSKVINFAGVSRLNGELKFRTATVDGRFAQLIKLGDTDVRFIAITATESKQAAAQELLTRGFADGDAAIQALLETVVADKPAKTAKPAKTKVKAKPAKKTVKVVKAKAVKVKVPTTFAVENAGAQVTVESADPKWPLSPRRAAEVRSEFMRQLNSAA
jgi:hypothetical protein